jgi:hypothetical protein
MGEIVSLHDQIKHNKGVIKGINSVLEGPEKDPTQIETNEESL